MRPAAICFVFYFMDVTKIAVDTFSGLPYFKIRYYLEDNWKSGCIRKAEA